MWGFFDKLFGMDFATASEKALIHGESPTTGFLKFGTKGPFTDIYAGMAGNVFVDWASMLGLLAIGLPLMLGAGVRLAAHGGIAMSLMMYTAGFIPPEHNPFMDEHVLSAIIFVVLPVAKAGHMLRLGRWSAGTGLVRRFRFLE